MIRIEAIRKCPLWLKILLLAQIGLAVPFAIAYAVLAVTGSRDLAVSSIHMTFIIEIATSSVAAFIEWECKKS